MKNGIDIDDAINAGIDLLQADVELTFEEIAADIVPDLPYVPALNFGAPRRDFASNPTSNESYRMNNESLPVNQEKESIENEMRSLRHLEVLSLRTEGKRIVGKSITIYISIVVSVFLFAYK